MNGLASHQAPVEHKDENDRVELERGTLEHGTPGKRVVDPALRHPVRHERVQPQRRRDRRALEVGRLAVGVLGDDVGVRGNVEAREARQAAQDKEAEAEVVERGADANGEGDDGGGDAEGDL